MPRWNTEAGHLFDHLSGYRVLEIEPTRKMTIGIGRSAGTAILSERFAAIVDPR